MKLDDIKIGDYSYSILRDGSTTIRNGQMELVISFKDLREICTTAEKFVEYMDDNFPEAAEEIKEEKPELLKPFKVTHIGRTKLRIDDLA
jgi:hypothetical protein